MTEHTSGNHWYPWTAVNNHRLQKGMPTWWYGGFPHQCGTWWGFGVSVKAEGNKWVCHCKFGQPWQPQLLAFAEIVERRTWNKPWPDWMEKETFKIKRIYCRSLYLVVDLPPFVRVTRLSGFCSNFVLLNWCKVICLDLRHKNCIYSLSSSMVLIELRSYLMIIHLKV